MDRKKYFIIAYDITSKSMHAANEIGERRKFHMIHLLHVICWNLRKTENKHYVGLNVTAESA